MKPVRAINQLLNDNKVVKNLMDQYPRSKDPEKKLEIACMLFRELKLHFALEEEIFYPMLEDRLETGDLIGEALDENQSASVLIEELETLGLSQREFDEKFSELTENIKHHMEEEEREIIPQAQQILLPEETEQLDSEMAEKRQDLIKEIIQESSVRKLRLRKTA